MCYAVMQKLLYISMVFKIFMALIQILFLSLTGWT